MIVGTTAKNPYFLGVWGGFLKFQFLDGTMYHNESVFIMLKKKPQKNSAVHISR